MLQARQRESFLCKHKAALCLGCFGFESDLRVAFGGYVCG